MKNISILVLMMCVVGCTFSQKERNKEILDSIQNIIINDNINIDYPLDEEDSSNIDINKLDLNKVYMDTVVFKQYMDYGDFNRFYVSIKNKNLYPLNDSIDRSLNRGDTAILTWKVDSIWIPEAPNDKWRSEISINIRKVKDGKLSLFKKKYHKPITYYCDDDIKEKYSEEDFDEIYNLVEYYLANSKNPLVISAIQNQSNTEEIEYSIEEQNKDEIIYTVIGISNYIDNHNSIFQWLYLKPTNYGYKIIYEYDLPNDKLNLFN